MSLHEQTRKWAPDYVAAADDYRATTLDLNSVMVEQLDASLGGTRAQGGKPHVHAPSIDWRDAVDVLERTQVLVDKRLGQMKRQGHQDEDTGN
jgi:hypothetical protein